RSPSDATPVVRAHGERDRRGRPRRAAPRRSVCHGGRPAWWPAFCAEGEAGHLPPSVRRTVAARDLRLQTGAGEAAGDADPRLRAPGAARRADDGAVVPARGEIAVRVQPARAV